MMVEKAAGLGVSFRPLPENLRAAEEDAGVPLRELLARLWRSGDADGRLTTRLTAPAVFRCLQIAREKGEAVEAVRSALRDACFNSWSDNAGALLGLSAVARGLSASLRDPDLAEAPLDVRYVAELVRSATLALAWDDSTGPLMLAPRATLAEALDLRAELAELARNAVIEAPAPHFLDHATFASYVRAAVAALKGHEAGSGPGEAPPYQERSANEIGRDEGS